MRRTGVLTIIVLSMSLLIGACAKQDVNAALLKAADSGNVDTVKGLLQKGANPNTSDEFKRTPLMIASLNGKADVVETLIKAGAEISAKAQFGQTALQFAIEGGHAGIVEMLKAAQGVNPPSPSPP